MGKRTESESEAERRQMNGVIKTNKVGERKKGKKNKRWANRQSQRASQRAGKTEWKN